MAQASDDHSASSIGTDSGTTEVAEQPVRPIGAWVIAGFVLLVTLAMWGFVAAVFYVRS